MMEIARCKTCKHWKADEHRLVTAFGLGVCKAVPLFWDSTRWNEKGDSRELVPEALNTTAFAQDASDYSAVLYTMPEHGCTMHKKIGTE